MHQRVPIARSLLIGAASVGFVGLISVATATSVQSVTTVPTGRLLASNCFQCHGTNGLGNSFESLAGESAKDLFHEIKEEQRKNSIMGVHARGYTDAQLMAIARYFASIPKP